MLYLKIWKCWENKFIIEKYICIKYMINGKLILIRIEKLDFVEYY